MARIVWDNVGERFYENGVDHCVLYPVANDGTYPTGVPWNGVTTIGERPSGADANKKWADNMNWLTIYGAEEFGATIEAFTYPDEWMECDGTAPLKNGTGTIPGVYVGQQPRRGFGLSYRTKIGNDTVGGDYGFKLHLVYGGRASTSDRSYETINDSPDAIQFSWEITTTPVTIAGMKPSAIITIDSRDFTGANAAKLTKLENALYGDDTNAAYLPLPNKLIEILTT